MYGIQVPAQFDFQKPELWEIWIKRFLRYISVTSMTNRPDKEKIDLLCYTMGEKAEEILTQVMPTISPETTFDAVKQKFDTYFSPKRNIVFERYKFNSRIQHVDEPVDLFITALYTLAETCDYGTLKEELIRDRIVIGICDVRTSERLQLTSNLTVEKAIESVRQAEIQAKENKIIRQEAISPKEVNKIIQKKTVPQSRNPGNSKHTPRKEEQKCTRCCLSRHTDVKKCPALNSRCRVTNLNLDKPNSTSLPVPSIKDGDSKSDDDASEEQISPAEKSLLQKIIRKGLVEMTKNIEIQRKDPNSPLYSVKTFDAFHLKPALLKGVYAMGFNAPSRIQETALPTLLADPPQNMIAQSQSGTGKTAAFVLAMLNRVDTTKDYPQVLCLSPTYELAIQIGEVAAKMSRFCPEIKIKYAVRGEEINHGSKVNDHIIIGTPGKVLDWGQKFKFFDLSKISVFILDEADVMIATQSHLNQWIRIHKLLPRTCQMMFFSVTYKPEVMNFAEIIVSNPLIIQLLRKEESLDNIKQYYIKCKSVDEKYTAITNIYGVITIGQAIIFCDTNKTASWLAEKMTRDGHAVAILSGDLTVEQRISVLDRFRAGLEKVLITTNVFARGIDVEQVTIVVNFDLPMDQKRQADCEIYLRRIGRTGRFGKSGIAINLIDSPHAMQLCDDIEKHFGKKIHYLDVEDCG